MRIFGPNGPLAPSSSPAARRSTSGTFSLPEGTTTPAPAGSTAPRTIGGIETLIALQGIETPEERRKRAVGRGRSALDVLDELKIALLAGSLEPAVLLKLKSAAATLKDKDGSGDPKLDDVLGEIELRVEVELAKMDPVAS